MRKRKVRSRSSAVVVALAAAVFVLGVSPTLAQVTPAQGYTPPDDTPTVKVGGTIFTDFTYTIDPTSVDGNGKKIHASAFDVKRAYINVTGNISHLVSFRITPDIARLLTAAKGLAEGQSVTNSLDGSEAFRLKYAYGQLNLDTWVTKGSWVRFGAQQTPYIDYTESVYRYRFQNPIFVDAEKFLSSSDFGLSGHVNFPKNYGDLHAGVYNGETYSKPEANDQKAFQVRGTVRPFPMTRVLRGLRATAFYDADRYASGAPRNRFAANLTFERPHFTVGAEYLAATDRTAPSASKVEANGYSVWIEPRTSIGVEGLLRYGSLKPDKNVDARKNRAVAGIAYWFPTQAAPAATAILLDYEQVDYGSALNKPDEKRVAFHLLYNF